ncbi:MAG TPA: dihydroorotase [Methanoregulaceae archaeon]|nr:dihydroorotase [Methanoregulaceae archaeon]
MKTCDLVISDILLPGGRRTDLSISKGVLVHDGAGLRALETIDAKGMLLLPAGTDMHAHMRDWCQSEKEDWESGSKSAIAGGITLVVDQPNTVPPLVTGKRVVKRVRLAKSRSLCHFAVNGGLTGNNDLTGLWNAGIMAFGEIFAAPSSFGEEVLPDDLVKGLSTICDLGGLATIHAETIEGESPRDLEMHNNFRSIAGEVKEVRKIVGCGRPGSRLHFCHLSNAAAIRAAHTRSYGPCNVPGQNNGPWISVEATPHHLLLSYEDFSSDDTRALVNPPLRSKKEQHRLLGLLDRVDVIASDHAPHTAREKAVPFGKAPSGLPGVETMIPLLLAQVKEKQMSIASLIEKTSHRPCEILGIPSAGLDRGQRMDFALYPADPVRIDPDMLHSRAGWTPFEGHPAIFPEIVVMGGEIVYKSGEFIPGSPRWYPGPGYRSTCDSTRK